MCDSFVHTNKNLQGGDYGSQAPIDMNGLLHSNWVSLPKITNQSIMGKQHTKEVFWKDFEIHQCSSFGNQVYY